MKEFWNHIKKAKGWLVIVAIVFLINTFTTGHPSLTVLFQKTLQT